MSLMNLLHPALMMGGGYLLKQHAENKAEKRRGRILGRMGELNTEALRKNIANLEDSVQQYRPELRMPAYEQAAERRTGSLTRDVLAPPSVPIGAQYSGRASENFTAGQAARQADEAEYAVRLARLMGRASAPAELAFEEGRSNIDHALDRERTNADLRGALGAEELRLGEVQPSPGLTAAGDLLSMGGMMAGTQDPYAELLAGLLRLRPSDMPPPEEPQIPPGVAAGTGKKAVRFTPARGRDFFRIYTPPFVRIT